MVYKNYYLWLVVRIVLLLLNVFLTGSSYVLMGTRDLLFLPLTLSLVLILQVMDLIIYLTRSNREIARFVENLSQQELSEKYDDKSVGPPFRSLYRALNKVITQLENTKLEKEAQFGYLQIIISHIKTGIISVKDDDEIVLLNDSAKELLGISDKSTWTDLKNKHPELAGEIDRIKGRGSKLVEMKINQAVTQLSVNVSSARILESKYRIITLQDIRSEIEQKEIEAWHKLIQILRHEIRNSVTPIASMTETIIMLLEDQAGEARKPSELSEQDLADIHSSIRTVHGRSEGLYKFVEKYRQLTKVPPPQKECIIISELIARVLDLNKKEAETNKVQFLSTGIPDDLSVDCDASLIEQVLINLIKNSIQALDRRAGGQISISSEETKNNIFLKVSDNGPGIDPEAIQDIFLPFFTTKEDGMGIGLSLSRQIMNLHGGTLSAESVPGKQTTFSLIFIK